jgi:hypothetical protein
MPLEYALIGGAGQGKEIHENGNLARQQIRGEPAQAADEVEMLPAGKEGVEVRFLGYVADARFVLDQTIGDIAPIEPDLARRGFAESGQQRDRRGLS